MHPEQPTTNDTRLQAFTDAAFAFAVTLLLVSVGDVPKSVNDLIESMKAIPAFAMSFGIIVMFWNVQVRWSSHYAIGGAVPTLLNLLLVFLVLIYVFPLRLMSFMTMDFMLTGQIHQSLEIFSIKDTRWLFAIYASGFALMCGTVLILFLYSKRKLIADTTKLEALSQEIIIWSILTCAGMFSLILAIFAPNPFIAPFAFAIIPFGIGLYFFSGYLRKKKP